MRRESGAGSTGLAGVTMGWGSAIAALLQVVAIDITLAGDNAVVVGLAVSGLPPRRRAQAMLIGIGLAAAIRVALAVVAVRLLAIVGLTLAGGLLLLWVCWRMVRELRRAHPAHKQHGRQKSLRAAILQIALADLSMSLDNVLAVAGAARAHLWILIGGLALSVLLMGLAAAALAALLERQRWIAWLGLAVVTYVALRMIADGWAQVAARL